MKLPMKFLYSGEGFESKTVGQVFLVQARLLFRPFIWKNRVMAFYKPSFSDSAWHKVPLDVVESVVSASNAYEAMSVLRKHPDYKPPVL